MTSASVAAILTEGIAELAQASAAVGVDWFAKRAPSDPDRVLVWTVYRTGRHPVTLLDQYAVQCRGRGARDDALDVDELMDPVAEWLASREHLDIGPVHIDQARFRSSAPLGIDDLNRSERADTFDLDLTPPASYTRLI